MAITVTVDATHRVARFEFLSPHDPNGMAYASGEVLLQEPIDPGDGADVLRVRSPMTPAPKEGERVTYGVMPGSQVRRIISEVAEETVDVDGATISLNTVLAACGAFFEKWRTEDANAPQTPSPALVQPTPLPSPLDKK